MGICPRNQITEPILYTTESIMYINNHRVLHKPIGAAIEWAIAPRFHENVPSQRQFSNPKPSSSQQINSNFKQWSKRFHDGKYW